MFEPFLGRKREVVRPSGGSGGSGGLGLGLFIARQIATAHGGDITVESTAATGTAVIVCLPRNTDDLPRVTNDSAETPAVSDRGPQMPVAKSRANLAISDRP